MFIQVQWVQSKSYCPLDLMSPHLNVISFETTLSGNDTIQEINKSLLYIKTHKRAYQELNN